MYIVGEKLTKVEMGHDGPKVEGEVIYIGGSGSGTTVFYDFCADAAKEAARRSQKSGDFREYIIFQAIKTVKAQEPVETAIITSMDKVE